MNPSPDYKALLAATPRRSKRSVEVAAEQRQRANVAASRAKTVLTHLYPDEYRGLYLAALEQLADERGPIDGVTA